MTEDYVIEAEQLKKTYGGRTVLDVERFRVRKGEIAVCLGPSGAGKSVFLRLLNLLEHPTSGEIRFMGDEVQDLKGRARVRTARKMAMLFQDPLLFSTSVLKNVTYGLRVRGVSREKRERKASQALGMVGLKKFGSSGVKTLSGGEAQRVALARALVCEPELIFLDEPFANLDRLNRETMQTEVKKIIKDHHLSAVFVTHDQEEAARMGDHIVILEGGRVIQEGTAEDVFYHPCSEFAARFVGMDNLYRGTVADSDDGLVSVDIEGGVIEALSDIPVGEEVTVGIRPDDITLFPLWGASPSTSARNAFQGEVVAIEIAGPTATVKMRCPFTLEAVVTRRSIDDLGIETGTGVGVWFKATAVNVMPGEGPPRG